MTVPVSVAGQGATILAAAGLSGGTLGWVIKVGQLPTSPDAAIALYDTPGQAPEVRYLLDYAGMMAMVRGAVQDYDGAYAKAKDIKDVFLGMDAQDVGADHWSGCICRGDINFLQYDTLSRPLFSINFQVFLERAASSLSNRTSL